MSWGTINKIKHDIFSSIFYKFAIFVVWELTYFHLTHFFYWSRGVFGSCGCGFQCCPLLSAHVVVFIVNALQWGLMQAYDSYLKGNMLHASVVLFIEEIANNLGYNVYYLIDLDSGVWLQRSRYQLEPIPVEVLAVGDDSDEFTMETFAVPEKSEENKRFASVSGLELDEVELNCCSFNSKNRHLGQ